MTTKEQRKRHVLNVFCFNAFQLSLTLERKYVLANSNLFFLYADTYNGKKKVAIRFKGNLTEKLTNSAYYYQYLFSG